MKQIEMEICKEVIQEILGLGVSNKIKEVPIPS